MSETLHYVGPTPIEAVINAEIERRLREYMERTSKWVGNFFISDEMLRDVEYRQRSETERLRMRPLERVGVSSHTAAELLEMYDRATSA